MAKNYETGFYFKQGDDFNFHLEEAGGNISEALKSWASHLEGASMAILRLSELFKDKNIKVDADNHMVNFSGDEEVLKQAAEEEILNAWDEEELEQECSECDCEDTEYKDCDNFEECCEKVAQEEKDDSKNN